MLIKGLLSETSFSKDYPPLLKDLDVAGITTDSRQVKDGWLFIAMQGTVLDGHTFIEDAIQRGARAVAVQADRAEKCKPFSERLPIFIVPDTHALSSALASAWYGRPSDRLQVIGVTGTNGKTTTAHLLSQFLKPLGATGMIGTVEVRLGEISLPSSLTTPDAWQLHSTFRQMLEEGLRYCAMEVSSHALAQSRADDVSFCWTVFTNLTQDHLDYHGDMENYFRAKRRLFFEPGARRGAVVNADDLFGRRLIRELESKVLTYGLGSGADYYAEDVHCGLEGSEFIFVTPAFRQSMFLPLCGEHNIYNFLAAAAIALEEGVPRDRLIEQAGCSQGVCGRLEAMRCGQAFHVFVDYAHTPDGMKRVLSFLRQMKTGSLITVFGCGGDRDRGKRPKMGMIAEDYSDHVIVTSDNPRSESPCKILEDIRQGRHFAKKTGWVEIEDRREAIHQALSIAKMGDIVAILGKGHENVQIVGKEMRPFSDQEVVRQFFRDGARVYGR